MNLFDLLRRKNEENEESLKKAELISIAESNCRLQQDEELKPYLKALKHAQEMYEFKKKELEKKSERILEAAKDSLAYSSTYNNLLSEVLNSRAYLGNKTLCTLLKSKTRKDWSMDVLAVPHKASLILQNDDEIFTLLECPSDKEKPSDFVVKRMENINWFELFLTSQELDGKRIYTCPQTSSQQGVTLEMPKIVEDVLLEYFKCIKIDIEHPEELVVDEFELKTTTSQISQKTNKNMEK